MVVTDSPSPLAAHKYLRRISKDFSTVRRYSNTPAVVSVRASTSAFIAAESAAHLPTCRGPSPTPRTPTSTPRGIRRRQRMRKRSSVSSTLSKVLILNVRDLLKTHAGGEPLKEVGHPKPLLNRGHPSSFAYPWEFPGAVCPLWIHVKPAKFATLALFAAITPKLQLAKVSIRNWNQLWQSQRIQVGMKT